MMIQHNREAMVNLVLRTCIDSAFHFFVAYTAYAQTYFIKVRNRLEQENADAFREFITTLGYFQSSETSTLELYKKIEVILGPHTDLFDEFVLFLSPEAAADCGVQFQHFLYVRMREFFYKLKVRCLPF